MTQYDSVLTVCVNYSSSYHPLFQTVVHTPADRLLLLLLSLLEFPVEIHVSSDIIQTEKKLLIERPLNVLSLLLNVRM